MLHLEPRTGNHHALPFYQINYHKTLTSGGSRHFHRLPKTRPAESHLWQKIPMHRKFPLRSQMISIDATPHRTIYHQNNVVHVQKNLRTTPG